MTARTGCILVAAGRGDRLGAGGPKALRSMAGVPLVAHAARAAWSSGVLDVLVVAAPAKYLDQVEVAIRPLGGHVVVVVGGSTRRDSVRAGLDALPADVATVLVHDAARCLAPPDLFVAVAAAVTERSDAVVPGLAVADTIKEVSTEDLVVRTLDRSVLRIVQTPQGFRRDVLVRAHSVAGDATDDAGLVERLGGTVRIVPGHEDAFKVTRPLDLLLAEAVLARRSAGAA